MSLRWLIRVRFNCDRLNIKMQLKLTELARSLGWSKRSPVPFDIFALMLSTKMLYKKP
ncbi:hypothetical protein [Leptolyngbya sp. FACHB-541]|uniref:hypothetical protein n=1 Tax=Leptolyngbya sp. FACHB-541 TaxID=2692810 RepID=UPI001683470C|nr:hypothetical protein [Leptolyngbya sp. FACHB-541]